MRRERGFTLIELIVVLTITAIMAAIAVPSFGNFMAAQRAKSASYELATTLLLARSEAIKRNANVQVAPITAGTWGNGWNVTVASSGASLQKQQAMATVTVTTTTASITFAGTGRPTASAKWEIASNGKSTRCVKLDVAGSASTTTGACT